MYLLYHIKYNILISLLMIGLFACNSKNDQLIDEINISTGNVIPAPLQKKYDLNKAVNDISTLKSIECATIGLNGSKSNQPDYLQNLSNSADTNELVNFIQSGNAYLKSYAFSALKIKGYTRLKDIFLQNLMNKEIFKVHCGCEESEMPVNIDFYNQLHSLLTEKEKTAYRNKLTEQYKNSAYYTMKLAL